MSERKGSAFAGVSTAVVTPFRDGSFDVATYREQLEFQIAAGVTGVVPAGTTGESPTLTHEEHERIIAETVSIVAGRVKVIAGTGSNSTREAVRLTVAAAKAGADAALLVAPYYNKPTQEGFYRHYRAIADETDLPLCVYNIPGRAGKNIEVETMVRLADIDSIVMVKEASGSLDQASRLLAETNLTVLSGDDSLTLPMMAVGGEGIISVVGNIVPELLVELVRAAQAEDYSAARQIHHRLLPLCRDMLGLSTNPIPVKAAMRLLGRDTGELRLPMVELDDRDVAVLKRTLTHCGLLEGQAVGT